MRGGSFYGKKAALAPAGSAAKTVALSFAAGRFLLCKHPSDRGADHREVLPAGFDAPAVPILAGAAAFCAAAVFSRFARQDLFLKGLLTQALFWTVMLLLGAALLGGETAWPRFFAALAVAAAGTAAAALLCGGGKRKKKFQKMCPSD